MRLLKTKKIECHIKTLSELSSDKEMKIQKFKINVFVIAQFSMYADQSSSLSTVWTKVDEYLSEVVYSNEAWQDCLSCIGKTQML